MKRVIIILAVAFTMFGFGTPTFAQSEMTISKGTSVADALNAVSGRGHSEGIAFDASLDGLVLDHDVSIEKSDSNLAAFRKVLSNTLEAYADRDGIVHIKTRGVAIPTGGLQQQFAPAPAAFLTFPFYDANAAARKAIADAPTMAAANAALAQLSIRQPRDYDPGLSYGGSYSFSRFDGFGSYGQYNPFYTFLPEGAIRTNGHVKGTDLWINGCYVGGANQFDSFWNQKLAAHANEMITVTVRRIKDNRSYDLPTRLTPDFIAQMVGGRHLPLTVNEADLERGKTFDLETARIACASSSIR